VAEEKKEDQPTKSELHKIRQELLSQMITLSTSGFGLVAALAWNDAIKGFVEQYIQPYFPNSVIWYRFIYAILITIFAVLITYNLSKISAKLGTDSE